jgi:hypothetical protein
MGVADTMRPKNMVANLNQQSIINMKAIDWNHESSIDHIACIHLTLGMNGDITPSSYTDWSTWGWWGLRRTSSMKMAVMKLWKTPRPAAWSPPLASFSPPALILATSSPNSLPHLAAALRWMDVDRMICSMGNHLGAPRRLYLCPWGAFGRAPPCQARDPPWERSKLGFHKISQIFLIRSPSLPAPYLPRPHSK